MKAIKKAQGGVKATKDSTSYFSNKARVSELKGLLSNNPSQINRYFNTANQAKKDQSRQKLKGKPGYDANGFPLKKKKMQTGGSIGSKVVKENPRQQKRLSRIKENNPERAAKVEKRMVRRADRAMSARGAASRMKKGGSIKKK